MKLKEMSLLIYFTHDFHAHKMGWLNRMMTFRNFIWKTILHFNEVILINNEVIFVKDGFAVDIFYCFYCAI